jgi:prepilin-type processing-associated H-X9-DG protein
MWPTERDAPARNIYTGSESGMGKEMARTAIARHGSIPQASATWSTPTQTPAGGINVGMFDGHLEYSKLPNLWNYSWHANWGIAPNTVAIGTPF